MMAFPICVDCRVRRAHSTLAGNGLWAMSTPFYTPRLGSHVFTLITYIDLYTPCRAKTCTPYTKKRGEKWGERSLPPITGQPVHSE